MLNIYRNITRRNLFGTRRFFSTSQIARNFSDGPKNVIKSSCDAGTPLNLKIKKTGNEPVALEDSEYPEWLWTILDKKVQEIKLSEDPAKLAKKEMRTRNKKKIKMNNFMEQMK
ncbi:hypothetical protein WICMUC_002606 [Wickerhamomyces mucosus]|uniref:Large ribosomal subunit protein mL54 n=1 Tax=Wickerhamomyces mucosus TaxID=1378264 RepID=A0A9P8PP70_9ASCO|nr:hypothetical protein WICMUC_002606 [Wickerhamomyces mucosus]